MLNCDQIVDFNGYLAIDRGDGNITSFSSEELAALDFIRYQLNILEV